MPVDRWNLQTQPAIGVVILSHSRVFSRGHFALTFKNKFDDGRDRLIARDMGSAYGTTVSYNGKGDKLRTELDWNISLASRVVSLLSATTERTLRSSNVPIPLPLGRTAGGRFGGTWA